VISILRILSAHEELTTLQIWQKFGEAGAALRPSQEEIVARLDGSHRKRIGRKGH
jgi:hypothetical protein